MSWQVTDVPILARWVEYEVSNGNLQKTVVVKVNLDLHLGPAEFDHPSVAELVRRACGGTANDPSTKVRIIPRNANG